ncbi:MAG: OsmC family protein [Gemmataceae bacterium]
MPNLTWDVRVTAASGETARVSARKHRWDVGAPLHFDSEYACVTALEMLLGALGSDLVNGLKQRARRRRLEITHIEASVQGELDNPLTYLGVVGETGHPGLRRVAVKVFVSTLASEEETQAVWRETLAGSPLVHTLRPTVNLELQLKIVL